MFSVVHLNFLPLVPPLSVLLGMGQSVDPDLDWYIQLHMKQRVYLTLTIGHIKRSGIYRPYLVYEKLKFSVILLS